MLEDRIYQDYVTALKAKEKKTSSFLSFLRATLKNKSIDLKKEKLDNTEVIALLIKEKKRILDTKESISSSGRQDLLSDVEKELSILNNYLPKPLSEEELTSIIDQTINLLQASSMRDMGKVMKSVSEKTGARADSKKISQLVKNKLLSL